MDEVFDLAVIGGGLEGCAIAREAAGQGLRVHLAAVDDLAGDLAGWAAQLVPAAGDRTGAVERDILRSTAPHLVRLIPLVTPHAEPPARWPGRLRDAARRLTGGGGSPAPGRGLDLGADPAGALLARTWGHAIEAGEFWIDATRLAVLAAVDAHERGAVIETRTRLVAAEPVGPGWGLTLDRGGLRRDIRARALVEAGPRGAGAHHVELVLGRALIPPRGLRLAEEGAAALACLPFEAGTTLLTPLAGLAGHADPGAAGEALLTAANRFLLQPLRRRDIVMAHAGPAPAAEPAAIRVETPAPGSPRLRIEAGPALLARARAEEALTRLAPGLGLGAARLGWTRRVPLPGGDIPAGDIAAHAAELARRHPYLGTATAGRLARAYGSRAEALLDGALDAEELGRAFGPGLHYREISHLVAREFARTADDILWRRSKLGLALSPSERVALALYLSDQIPTRGRAGNAGETGRTGTPALS
ncbi:glycerol-3-phosphate dehydrogenase C-terminal domain-containing protein [Rhabdaerophilum calidifontis]|uniref:glycerol-3-phosphate dehydrogenase C-terminal domain-containing protein n=1 Tax=Rhabdaerophilum calidifontis TaxID=2604328 RepID=UPI00123BC911|nr:glycerol-3-phosphate dehydrogenase C-terminal domain-containing protein [Rhabdaerophilum calidifontis]